MFFAFFVLTLTASTFGTEVLISSNADSARVLRYTSAEKAGFTVTGIDSINILMQHAVADSVFPGAVLLIARDGNIVLHQACGLFGYGEFAKPLARDAIYDLASVTKVVATTTACMLLYERSLLDLDAPVQQFLPEFVGEGKGDITVRHLLTHTSGLIAFRQYFREYNSADEILSVILKDELEYPTGSKTVYSDLGVILLGKIIERLSNLRLDEFCKSELFEPLGMKDSFYDPPNSLRFRIAPTELDTVTASRKGKITHGVVHDENAYVLGGVSGHAGLFSTAKDLAIFMQMLLNGGSYGEIRLLRPETIARFTKRQNLVMGSSRALGWDTANGENSAGKLMSENSYGHTGFTGTSVWTDPERKLIVILLSNRVHPTRANRRIIRFRPVLHDAIVNAMVR